VASVRRFELGDHRGHQRDGDQRGEHVEVERRDHRHAAIGDQQPLRQLSSARRCETLAVARSRTPSKTSSVPESNPAKSRPFDRWLRSSHARAPRGRQPVGKRDAAAAAAELLRHREHALVDDSSPPTRCSTSVPRSFEVAVGSASSAIRIATAAGSATAAITASATMS